MPLPPAPPLQLQPKERRELKALITKQTMSQRTVRRARILLHAANGVANAEIARRVQIAPTHVVQTRPRFEERGLESVYHDASGCGRRKMISETKLARLVETVLEKKPKNATHWSSRDLAARHGVSFCTVQRILRAHNLQPHRIVTLSSAWIKTRREVARYCRALYGSAGERTGAQH